MEKKNLEPYLGEPPSPLNDVLRAVAIEYLSAERTFPPFNSAHEGFAVLLEEVDELKHEVWKHHGLRSSEHLRKEATQVAAMAVRFLTDVINKTK